LFWCSIFWRQRHMLLIHCIVIRESSSHGSISSISRLNWVLRVTLVVLFRKKEILSASSTIIISYSWCICIIYTVVKVILVNFIVILQIRWIFSLSIVNRVLNILLRRDLSLLEFFILLFDLVCKSHSNLILFFVYAIAAAIWDWRP
jgi:hypothetical protein